MEENGLHNVLDRFDEVLKAAVFAVAGYGILDVNVDGDSPSPVEIFTAHALISEYEFLALDVLGTTKSNVEIIQCEGCTSTLKLNKKLVGINAAPIVKMLNQT